MTKVMCLRCRYPEKMQDHLESVKAELKKNTSIIDVAHQMLIIFQIFRVQQAILTGLAGRKIII